MVTAQQPRPLLKIDEACEVLRISRPTLYLLINSGRLPIIKLGRSTRVAVDDVEALMRGTRLGGDEAA